MENLLSMPLLSEVDTEESKILGEMVQLLNYICVAPTLNRQELANKLIGVATKCMDTFKNQKMRIQALEQLHTEVTEQPEDVNVSECQEDKNLEDSEKSDDDKTEECHTDQLLSDLQNPTTGQTIVSSTSKYTVEDILGNGTFGVVAQCVKKPANDTVALKIIKDRSSIEEAEEEVEILDVLKDLGCEYFNIACCRDSFMFHGHFCMEFQKLDVSLLAYIKAQGPLELKDIRPVHQQMTVGLNFLKDAGVVHCDLKPENIMLVDHVQQPLKVQIIDFGLATRNPEESTGQVFGTLEYISPEILLGVPTNSQTDVWSSGCIAGEMLTGTRLFHVCDEWELIHCIVSVVGRPPNDMLERGVNTKVFFKGSPSQPTQDWVLKPLGAGRHGTFDVKHKKLQDLLKATVAVPTEDDQAAESDRLAFIDLIEKMLNTDVSKRISPEEILAHPFLTLSHLSDERHSSYLKSSIERMTVCDDWIFGGVENAPQPISSTSTNANWETEVLITEPLLNSKEEPSGQEDFRGEESSPEEPRFEDSNWSECISSSPEKNEDETQCLTPDCSSRTIENALLKRKTRRPGLLKRVKAAIMRRIRKLSS